MNKLKLKPKKQKIILWTAGILVLLWAGNFIYRGIVDSMEEQRLNIMAAKVEEMHKRLQTADEQVAWTFEKWCDYGNAKFQQGSILCLASTEATQDIDHSRSNLNTVLDIFVERYNNTLSVSEDVFTPTGKLPTSKELLEKRVSSVDLHYKGLEGFCSLNYTLEQNAFKATLLCNHHPSTPFFPLRD